MLIGYDPASGEVVWNSGTNTAYPYGPPDDVVQELTGRDDLALLRLHDEDDAELVQTTFTHHVLVVDGELTVGDELPGPDPAPEPSPPVTREEFQAQQDALDWLTVFVTTGEA